MPIISVQYACCTEKSLTHSVQSWTVGQQRDTTQVVCARAPGFTTFTNSFCRLSLWRLLTVHVRTCKASVNEMTMPPLQWWAHDVGSLIILKTTVWYLSFSRLTVVRLSPHIRPPARPDDCVMSRNPSPHNVALTVMEHNHCNTSALVSVLYDLPWP